MGKVGDELPWDRPKADPDDVDMFAQLAEPEPVDDRLTLARIAARPILEDPPPSSE